MGDIRASTRLAHERAMQAAKGRTFQTRDTASAKALQRREHSRLFRKSKNTGVSGEEGVQRCRQRQNHTSACVSLPSPRTAGSVDSRNLHPHT